MTTKTKTPSTKKATAKKELKKPAAKAPRKITPTLSDAIGLLNTHGDMLMRMQSDLSLIRSGMDFMEELKNARQLQDMKEIGEKWDTEEAPKPAGLQPGDYCQSDEHHDLKEVAERLTAMGWGWYDLDRSRHPIIRRSATEPTNMINHRSLVHCLKLLSTSEFLSRAEVTAKELGLTPVVPELIKEGDWVEVVGPAGLNRNDRHRGTRAIVNDWTTSYTKEPTFYIPSIDCWFRASSLRKLSPAEVQAHQEQVAAKEEAARKLGRLSLGALVQTPDGEGAYWFHNTAQGHKVVFEKGQVGTFNIDELTIVQ